MVCTNKNKGGGDNGGGGGDDNNNRKGGGGFLHENMKVGEAPFLFWGEIAPGPK